MPNEFHPSEPSARPKAKALYPYFVLAALPRNRSKLKLLRQQVANAGYWIEARAISERISEFYTS